MSDDSAQKTPAPDPMLGQVIGGCRIDQCIGRGGMGFVYRATQLSVDRVVAVKILRPDLFEGDELIRRFQMEAKTLGKFNSPHIVQIYEVGREGELPFLVMEFLSGGSLSHHVKRFPEHKLPRADAVRMLLECCMGLSEAWQHNVLHRDIKPDNLLLDGQGRVKIGDFGIAKLIDQDSGLTQAGFSPGTPAFMSPEQLAGRDLDFRADMYSLAAAFWYLLTGRKPENATSRLESLKLSRPRRGEAPSISSPEIVDYPDDELMQVICRMMALSRDDRFTSWPAAIAAVQRAGSIDSFDVTSDTIATSPTPIEVRRAPRPTVRAVWWTIGALAIGGAGLWAAIGGGRTSTPTHVPPPVASTDSGKPADVGARPEQTAATTGQPPAVEPAPAEATPKTAAVDVPKPPEAAPPAGGGEAPPSDPKADFLASLQRAFSVSPGFRSAADVERDRQAISQQAAALELTDHLVVKQYVDNLGSERIAAELLGELEQLRALPSHDQHAALRGRVAALTTFPRDPGYAERCRQRLERLWTDRPAHLRVDDPALRAAAPDLRQRPRLEYSVDTEMVAIGRDRAGEPRYLPRTVVDRKRDCTMVLLPPWIEGEEQYCYLDAAEVTWAQWDGLRDLLGERPRQPTEGIEAVHPIHGIAAAEVQRFVASGAGLRLPTIGEYERALGWPSGGVYWWGNQDPKQGASLPWPINIAGSERGRGTFERNHQDGSVGIAAAVDPAFRQGAGGLFHHLIGNVAERVIAPDGTERIVGGNFMTGSFGELRHDARAPMLGADGAVPRAGFRCALTVRIDRK